MRELSIQSTSNALSVQKPEAQILDARVDDVASQIRALCDFMDANRPVSDTVRQLMADAERLQGSDEYKDLVQLAARASEKVTERELRVELGLLIAAFPNAPKGDLKAFGALLLQDCADLEPSRYGLATACRELRRTKKWLPSIAEVIEALSAAERRLKEQKYRIENVPRVLEKARYIEAEYARIETRKKGLNHDEP